MAQSPNPFVRSLARAYNEAHGMAAPVEGHYVSVDESLARAIVEAYEQLPVVDTAHETVNAYLALAIEIGWQYEFATRTGVVFEPWQQEGQPYQNSSEMCADVRDHKHLWFFTGGEPHPFLSGDAGDGLTFNDKFRAVHDLFGHAAEGFQFGPRGEENAWIHHSMMFSHMAQRALSTETRGQNSWFNFGPYRHLPPAERPFAVQKAALLPESLTDWQAALAR